MSLSRLKWPGNQKRKRRNAKERAANRWLAKAKKVKARVKVKADEVEQKSNFRKTYQRQKRPEKAKEDK